MDLGREILGIGEKEFIVSKVNSTFGLRAGQDIEKIPSFRSVVKNIYSITLEPFRSRKIESAQDMSVFEFFDRRFGKSFAERYAYIVTRSLNGQSDAQQVSIHALLPRMAKNFHAHKSVLLGPLISALGGSEKRNSPSFTNVMDHLWQELMSGGKYVSMVPGVDLSGFFQQLDRHTSSVCSSVSGRAVSVGTKEIECEDGSKHPVDLIVSSWRPDTLMEIFSSPPEEFAKKLSAHEKLHATRFVWSCDEILKSSIPPVLVSTDNMMIIQSGLYEYLPTFSLIIDVLSPNPTSLESFRESSKQVLTGKLGEIVLNHDPVSVDVDSEELPRACLGSNEALIQFNKWRLGKVKKFQTDLQVVGKWYYAPSGSVTDLVADAHELAVLVASRYENYPKRENELRSHWMNRSDRSLDFSYQTDAVSTSTRLS
jgi:hypothetical protein